MRQVSAFACGAFFAIGLGVAGMTQPRKILGFLDVAGAWDPSLALVMGGALAVTAIAFPRILRRRRPLLDERFALPTRRDVDAPLLAGATLFGIGWGLAGYCPGPAIVSLVTATPSALMFVAAMMTGIWITRLFDRP